MALHPRDDIDGLYVSRKEGRIELISIKDYVDASIQKLGDYIKKRKEKLITAASNSTENIRTRKTVWKTRKQKWEEKQLYGYVNRQTD